jgi:hypothetical protein
MALFVQWGAQISSGIGRMFEGNAQNTANFLIVFSPLTAPAQVFGTVSHTYRRVFEKLECIRIDDANAGIEIGTGNFRLIRIKA